MTTKQDVLTCLQQAKDYLSGEQIAQALDISRAAVWKWIDALRREGYEIESRSGRGYRLLSTPDVMTQAAVLAQLGRHPWAERVTVLPIVDSTNTALKRMAADGAPDGTILIADEQTGGRGRLGRQFDSPPGMGLYLSVLLRPQGQAAEATHATLRAGLAVADAVEAVTGLQVGIKWPNDLVYGTQKLCGILSEMGVEAESGRMDWLIVGIGVNCNQLAGDFPPELRSMAASLRQCCGQPVLRARLAAALIRQLTALEDDLADPSRYLPRYAARCITLHREVQLARAGTLIHAVATGIAPDGGLEVRLDDGSAAVFGSGEVSVRGMYGYCE